MFQIMNGRLLLNSISERTRVRPFDKLRINRNRRSIGAVKPGILQKIIRKSTLLLFAGVVMVSTSNAQDTAQKKSSNRILYGTASFYSNKFQGRKTANGEIFDQKKMTAACNVLPLGTWIRVTNLRNKKSVVVKTNDRLHTKMKRIVDLSRAAASQLGYIGSGLTRVKVEVLGKKKPAQ